MDRPETRGPFQKRQRPSCSSDDNQGDFNTQVMGLIDSLQSLLLGDKPKLSPPTLLVHSGRPTAVKTAMRTPPSGEAINLGLKEMIRNERADWTLEYQQKAMYKIMSTENNSLRPSAKTGLPSQSVLYTMTEVMKLALGPIPGPLPEPLLLAPIESGEAAPSVYYCDDIWNMPTQEPSDSSNSSDPRSSDLGSSDYRTLEEQWAFIRDHLLPRLLWALFRLSFRKVKIGMTEIKALGWTRHVGATSALRNKCPNNVPFSASI